MSEDSNPLLTVHRWLATTTSVSSQALGIWAWRRPGQDRSIGMIVALTIIAAAVVVQAWYGGAMVHGIDYLN